MLKDVQKRRAYAREYYRLHPEQRTKHILRGAEWNRDHKERHNEISRKRNRRLKIEVLQHYGGFCYCCGESIIEFLALDHINGGGNQQRKAIGSVGGVSFYRWLKLHGWPEGFQVACHNCNLGRQLNAGICPHQKKD